MPYASSIGTYLPCWASPRHRVPGDDEDASTLAVEAGRAALGAGGAVVGTTNGFPSGNLADTLGLPELPVTRVKNSCATGSDAVRSAANQIDRARIGLAHNVGGPTAVPAVTILEGPGTDGD